MSTRIVGEVRAAYRASCLALVTLAQLGAVEAHQRVSSTSRREAVFDRHMRQWVRTLLRVFGVRLLIDGVVPASTSASRMIVSNHRSPIDIAVVLSLFGGQVLSRADLADWPIIGTAARKAGTIFVDRSESASGAQAIRQMRRRFQSGATISVFPEGTTFAGDEVRPFRMGAFVGIRGVDLDVVPVGIAYEDGSEFVDETFLAHLRRSAKRSSTPVAVSVGEPRKVEGKTADFGQLIHADVQQLVYRARRVLQKSLQR